MSSNHAIVTSRLIAAPPDRVFDAMVDPVRLARWWGPRGFTNTFETCDLHPGGAWRFVMHGPDGKNYPNENEFVALDRPSLFAIRHIVSPQFDLTVSLAPEADGTRVTWRMVFATDELHEKFATFVLAPNEQNLDRLTAEVTR